VRPSEALQRPLRLHLCKGIPTFLSTARIVAFYYTYPGLRWPLGWSFGPKLLPTSIPCLPHTARPPFLCRRVGVQPTPKQYSALPVPTIPHQPKMFQENAVCLCASLSRTSIVKRGEMRRYCVSIVRTAGQSSQGANMAFSDVAERPRVPTIWNTLEEECQLARWVRRGWVLVITQAGEHRGKPREGNASIKEHNE
jgi:hypothetical protein